MTLFDKDMQELMGLRELCKKQGELLTSAQRELEEAREELAAVDKALDAAGAYAENGRWRRVASLDSERRRCKNDSEATALASEDGEPTEEMINAGLAARAINQLDHVPPNPVHIYKAMRAARKVSP